MQTLLDTPHCQLTLYRYPRQSQETLQAWDAADEYLINTLAESPLEQAGPVIVMNDGFGALAAAGWIEPADSIYAGTRWMWLSAFFGMSTAFAESTLSQIFKEKRDGQLMI